MSRNIYNVDTLPAAGPYSHAVDSDGTIYLSGQTPFDPKTGRLAEGGIANQTRQCFSNLFTVLDGLGLDESSVQKVTVFLTDMADFAQMNEVYKEQFVHNYPARTTVGVAALPMGASVEIELIAGR